MPGAKTFSFSIEWAGNQMVEQLLSAKATNKITDLCMTDRDFYRKPALSGQPAHQPA